MKGRIKMKNIVKNLDMNLSINRVKDFALFSAHLAKKDFGHYTIELTKAFRFGEFDRYEVLVAKKEERKAILLFSSKDIHEASDRFMEEIHEVEKMLQKRYNF